MLSGEDLLEIAYRTIIVEGKQSEFNVVTGGQDDIPPPLNAEKDGGFSWLIFFEILLIIVVGLWIAYMLGALDRLKAWYAARKEAKAQESTEEEPLMVADSNAAYEGSTEESYY